MKREIKFRGKRIDNGEWVEGSLIQRDTTKIGYVSPLYGTWSEVAVSQSTVGQYTGLKDRNSKEIYEGDILKDHSGVGEVEWVQEHCAFRVFVKDPDFGNMYMALESDGQMKYTEVIGNIYELEG